MITSTIIEKNEFQVGTNTLGSKSISRKPQSSTEKHKKKNLAIAKER